MWRTALLCWLLVAGCDDATAVDYDPVVWEPPAPSALSVIHAFQGCLDQNDFFVARMDRWSFEAFTVAGPCANCHNTYGMFSFDHVLFIDGMRSHVPNLLLLYAFHPADDGSIVVNDRRLQALADGADEHPAFSFDDYLRQPLEDFRVLAYDRMARDECSPTPLPRRVGL